MDGLGIFSGSGEILISCLRGSIFIGDRLNFTFGEDEMDLFEAILVDLGLDVLNLLLQRLEGE